MCLLCERILHRDLLVCFWWYINFHGLFKAKAILEEEQEWCYLTHCGRINEVHAFLKGIRPKVNAIARFEFELAYNDIVVQHVSYCATETPYIDLLVGQPEIGLADTVSDLVPVCQTKEGFLPSHWGLE